MEAILGHYGILGTSPGGVKVYSRLSLRLSVVVAALVAVALVGLGALVLMRGASAARRFEALFRRPEKPPKPPGRGHYYRPYWS